MASESGKRRTDDDRATQGQTGDTPRQPQGNADELPDPNTQAGAPPRQDQARASLNAAGEQSESGRARDEGPDAIERTQAQRPRRDPDALVSSDAKPGDRETL
jgi:hypothetical protein